MKIEFEDKDLEELITTGRNSKYKKYTRNAKFMNLDDTHYGNKKWEPCTLYGCASWYDD